MKIFQQQKDICKRAKKEKWCLLILFPPWYVSHWIRTERKNNNEDLQHSDIFFILWILFQWLLMFFTNKVMWIGLITANLALSSFLIFTSVFIFTPRGLDMSLYPFELQRFLKSLTVQILGILPAVALMNICSSSLYLIVGSIKAYFKMLAQHGTVTVSMEKKMELIINSFYWTGYHTAIQLTLIFFLVVFVIVNRYKTLELLPVLSLQGKLELFSTQKIKSLKFNVLAIYILMIPWFLVFNSLGFTVKEWWSIMFKLPGF